MEEWVCTPPRAAVRRAARRAYSHPCAPPLVGGCPARPESHTRIVVSGIGGLAGVGAAAATAAAVPSLVARWLSRPPPVLALQPSPAAYVGPAARRAHPCDLV